jgi:acyl carrier protein phosphodiesterase
MMNFLAHIYLSGDSREILIGNFIGDYVKGKKITGYPQEVKQGIMLHRKIDSFTDKHIITRSSRKIIAEKYGLYAGIVVDIYYDHFLSANWQQYSETPLREYIHDRYRLLDSGFSIFPAGVKSWFPYFIKSNWLETYTNFNGLNMVFRRMSYRTSLPDHAEYAVSQLKQNYDFLKENFIDFFAELREMVQTDFNIIL